MFKITEINIFPASNAGSVVAYCRIVLNNVLAIQGIRLVKGLKGIFVSWPSLQAEGGKSRRNVVWPIDKDLHLYLDEEITWKYRETLANPVERKVY